MILVLCLPMPYFKVPLNNNRFIIGSVVFDAQKLNQEKLRTYLESGSFEGDDRSINRALIDTGATHCSITEELAQKLCLNPIGRITVGTAGHPVECNQYVVMLGIPVTEVYAYRQIVDEKSKRPAVVPAAHTNHFKLHLTRVSAMPRQETVRDFHVIIGMDFLGKMTFQYSGDPAFPEGNTTYLTIGF